MFTRIVPAVLLLTQPLLSAAAPNPLLGGFLGGGATVTVTVTQCPGATASPAAPSSAAVSSAASNAISGSSSAAAAATSLLNAVNLLQSTSSALNGVTSLISNLGNALSTLTGVLSPVTGQLAQAQNSLTSLANGLGSAVSNLNGATTALQNIPNLNSLGGTTNANNVVNQAQQALARLVPILQQINGLSFPTGNNNLNLSALRQQLQQLATAVPAFTTPVQNLGTSSQASTTNTLGNAVMDVLNKCLVKVN